MVGAAQRLICGQPIVMSVSSPLIAALPTDEVSAATDAKTAIPLCPTEADFEGENLGFYVVWTHINGFAKAARAHLKVMSLKDLLSVWHHMNGLLIPLTHRFVRVWITWTLQAFSAAMYELKISEKSVPCRSVPTGIADANALYTIVEEFRNMLMLLPLCHTQRVQHALSVLSQIDQVEYGDLFMYGPAPKIPTDYSMCPDRFLHYDIDDKDLLRVVDVVTRVTLGVYEKPEFMRGELFGEEVKLDTPIPPLKDTTLDVETSDDEVEDYPRQSVEYLKAGGLIFQVDNHGWHSSAAFPGKRLYLLLYKKPDALTEGDTPLSQGQRFDPLLQGRHFDDTPAQDLPLPEEGSTPDPPPSEPLND